MSETPRETAERIVKNARYLPRGDWEIDPSIDQRALIDDIEAALRARDEMNAEPECDEGYPCPVCKKCIEKAEVWADGQCPHCQRYYTWEDQVEIVDHDSMNEITIDRDEYERLKAAASSPDQ